MSLMTNSTDRPSQIQLECATKDLSIPDWMEIHFTTYSKMSSLLSLLKKCLKTIENKLSFALTTMLKWFDHESNAQRAIQEKVEQVELCRDLITDYLQAQDIPVTNDGENLNHHGCQSSCAQNTNGVELWVQDPWDHTHWSVTQYQ